MFIFHIFMVIIQELNQAFLSCALKLSYILALTFLLAGNIIIQASN